MFINYKILVLKFHLLMTFLASAVVGGRLTLALGMRELQKFVQLLSFCLTVGIFSLNETKEL